MLRGMRRMGVVLMRQNSRASAPNSHAILYCSHTKMRPLLSPNHSSAPAWGIQLSLPSHPRRTCTSSRGRMSGSRASSLEDEGKAIQDEERAFTIPDYCSGCGVKLQSQDSDIPGYFTVPKAFLEDPSAKVSAQFAAEGEVEELPSDEGDVHRQEIDKPDGTISRTLENQIENPEDTSTSDRPKWLDDEATREAIRKLDMLFDEPNHVKTQQEDEDEELDEPRILCARCYSLQNYGKVKSQKAETMMPGFDLGKKVGRKLALQKFRRPVILCVVDMADFDGSLPRAALASLLPQSMLERGRAVPKSRAPVDKSWNAERVGGIDECRFIVAANKADLLPVAASSETMEGWIRRRVRHGGLPKPDAVHLVSSTRQQGIKDLLADLQRSAGIVGDVWVVGAQNAGKSTLINAMRRAVGRKSKTKDVTTAPLPGTTLGTLRVDGVMQGRCRMFDTPGVLHTHQISSVLTPDEVRMVLPRSQIKPRSFRISPGQSIHLGGLARVDVVTSSSATLYLTVWMSNDVPCHYGKTEKAEERFAKMAGTSLVPPLGPDRCLDFGDTVPFSISVEGDDWKRSTTDIAIAGLGWIAVGTGGSAHLKIWTYPNVAITKHEALLSQFAPNMEKPGLGNRTLKPPKAAKRKPLKQQQLAL